MLQQVESKTKMEDNLITLWMNSSEFQVMFLFALRQWWINCLNVFLFLWFPSFDYCWTASDQTGSQKDRSITCIDAAPAVDSGAQRSGRVFEWAHEPRHGDVITEPDLSTSSMHWLFWKTKLYSQCFHVVMWLLSHTSGVFMNTYKFLGGVKADPTLSHELRSVWTQHETSLSFFWSVENLLQFLRHDL